jgi:hypothetical protein
MPRAWTLGDPEPAARPPVVDKNSDTWSWDDEEQWNRQATTRHPGGGVSRGPIDYSWNELLDEYGPLTEATEVQARSWTYADSQPVNPNAL